MFKLHNVTLQNDHKDIALRCADFSIEEGALIGLVGKYSKEQSLFLKAICGIISPKKGNIYFMHKVNEKRRWRPFFKNNIFPDCSYIAHNMTLINHASIYDNIALPLKGCGVDIDFIHTRIRALLQWVDLEAQSARYPHEVDHSLHILILLVRAIILKPKCLIVDGFFINSENNIEMKIAMLFKQLHQSGMAIVFSSEYQPVPLQGIGRYYEISQDKRIVECL